MKKLSFLLFIASILFTTTCAQKASISKQYHKVNEVLETLLIDKDLKNGGLTFFAIDLNTNEIVAEANSDMVLQPASVFKLVSTSTILEILGPDYQFKTKIEHDGEIDVKRKVLKGNIYIKGSGDPSLGSEYFFGANANQFLIQWCDSIKKIGIDSISGAVIGDASIYGYDMVPPTWSWEDMGNYFGAGACGLTVFDNMYRIVLRSGFNVGDTTKIVRMFPEIPGMTFDNQCVAGNTLSDDSFIYGIPYDYHRTIRGEIPKGRNEFPIGGSMPDPANFAALEFTKMLNSKGIKVLKKHTTLRELQRNGKFISVKRNLLFTWNSPRLIEIIKKTNVYSINLFAEHFLTHIGLIQNKKGDTKPGAEAVMQFWRNKAMDSDGFSVNDGSGLSKYNTISAKQMVYLLKYMRKQSKYANEFYNTLPLAGVEGTMAGVGKGTFAYNNLRAKTGMIRKVRSFAGYVTTRNGRELAFCMIANNFNCPSYMMRDKFETLLIALAELSI